LESCFVSNIVLLLFSQKINFPGKIKFHQLQAFCSYRFWIDESSV
jgi:hypothetical protein